MSEIHYGHFGKPSIILEVALEKMDIWDRKRLFSELYREMLGKERVPAIVETFIDSRFEKWGAL